MRMLPIGNQERRCHCEIFPSFMPVWPKFMLPVKLFLPDETFLAISPLENRLLLKFEKHSCVKPTHKKKHVSRNKIDL